MGKTAKLLLIVGFVIIVAVLLISCLSHFISEQGDSGCRQICQAKGFNHGAWIGGDGCLCQNIDNTTTNSTSNDVEGRSRRLLSR